MITHPLYLLIALPLALAALGAGLWSASRAATGVKVVGQHPGWQGLGLALVIAGLGLGLSAPRWGKPEVARLTVQVVLDASKSMGVKDAGGRARFDAATSFLDRLWSEPTPGAAWGLEALTGDLVPLLPPGEDRTLLRETLLAVKPGDIGAPGSSFGRGLAQVAGEVDKGRPAIVLLLSDGEETWESESDASMRAIAALKKAKLPLYAVVLGGASPQPVPGAKAADGKEQTSSARPDFLKALCVATGGRLITTPEEMRTLARNLMQGTEAMPATRSPKPAHPEAGAWLALLGFAIWLFGAGRPMPGWRLALLLPFLLITRPVKAQSRFVPSTVKAWIAQRALDNDDLKTAKAWSPSDDAPDHRLLAAAIALRSHQPGDAAQTLAPLVAGGVPRPLPPWRAPALLMAARAQHDLGKTEDAKALLIRLLMEAPGQADAIHDLQALTQDPTPPPPPDPQKPPPPPPMRPSMGAQKDELEGRQIRMPKTPQAPKGVKDI
ncbi:MAG: VWA domain-containing protein [Acidobacteria bacterium]|nr:VWA domain-containing protein [Acidobacteriota bacterium]